MFKNNWIVDALIVLIIIVFLRFFSFTLVEENSKLGTLGIIGPGILLSIFTLYSYIFKKGIEKKVIDRFIIYFIFCMVLSTVTANLYWDQSFIVSLKEYKYFYIYFLYFLPILLNIEKERLNRILIILFLFSVFIFLIDFVTFPDPLFSYRTEERREGRTIFFFGQGFTFLGGFYFLNKYVTEKKIIFLILFAIACGCLFLLTQSRMNLLALGLGFFLIFLTSNFSKKYFIAFALVVISTVVYTSTNIFSGVKEASKDQSQNYKEDIRLQAHNYFLTSFQGGPATVIFGNGFPSADSKLGLESLRGNLLGYWTADVGLTGIFSYFGLLGVLVWLLLFYYVLKIKVSENSMYIKGYFLALLSTALTGYSIFDPGYMPATILALSLLRYECI